MALRKALSMQGTLPGEAWSKNMLDLEELNLKNNSINGTLPEAWFEPTTFASLTLLDLRDNQLTGPLPPFTADSRLHKDAPRYAVKWDPPNATELDVRLYLEPMATGWGLCGNLTSIKVVYNSSVDPSSPGFLVGHQELWMDRFPRDCPGEPEPYSSAIFVGVAVGCGVAAAVVVCLLALAGSSCLRRRGGGPKGTVPAPLKQSQGSSRPKNKGGSAVGPTDEGATEQPSTNGQV
jgi:hypothetical protein